MNRKRFRDMPQVELVLIPELGQPRSLTYSDSQEARFCARGFARRGPQKIVAWYVLDDNGLILDHHGWAMETLKMLRPDAHTEKDLQRDAERMLTKEERAQSLLDRMDSERRMISWN